MDQTMKGAYFYLPEATKIPSYKIIHRQEMLSNNLN
jgi:hypothetical protein